MASDVYGPYVSVTKTGQKVLIVECLNAVYGTMVAALLYYKKFVKSLKSQAFKLNPYDGCMANKIVKGKQITIFFHVDDCKISHEVPQVIDETMKWLKAEYESIFEDGSGEMKVHRGKVHTYLGMSLDFTNKGQCIVTMNEYLAEIVKTHDLIKQSMMMGFYLSISSITRHLLLRTCSRLMRTVISCQSRWQQISSPLLQRCCM